MEKSKDKCIEKAFEDEMLFVLMARDVTAPTVIMEWIKMNLHTQPKEKLEEAADCVMKMIEQQPVMRQRAEDLKRLPSMPAMRKFQENSYYMVKEDFNSDWEIAKFELVSGKSTFYFAGRANGVLLQTISENAGEVGLKVDFPDNDVSFENNYN